MLDDYLENHPGVESACYNAIGQKEEDAGPAIVDVDNARKAMAEVVKCDNCEPVNNVNCQTSIRAGLLGSWARMAKDPAAVVEKWCRERGARQHCPLLPQS